ncbi:MAG TPA: hypothetical protein VFM29_10075 [Vicinamibacteria bacterium]|nr:hypothetical protein [Vicinamibacteria bacterium]
MTKRGATLLGATLLALGCSHPEKGVVDQFFNAANAKDAQTLASFSAVSFDQKVDRWDIKGTSSETENDMPLPALVQKVKDLEAELNNNTRAARAYNTDHWQELDQVKALAKGAAVPAKLQPVKAEWDKYNEKDRELKRAIASAKDAVEKEKRAMARSVGQVDNLDALAGKVKEKVLDLELTIAGQARPYTMVVRKYEPKAEGGQRVMSRWMIQSLQPKA